VDVLLNCAGVVSFGFMVNRKGEIGDNSEIWRCLNINLIGTINVSKYIAKYMIK
jgi:short-subunit dehydrogenase